MKYNKAIVIGGSSGIGQAISNNLKKLVPMLLVVQERRLTLLISNQLKILQK